MSEPTARVADPLDTYEQYARWAVPPLMSRERWQGRREPCLRSVDGWCLTHSTGQGPAWFTGAAGRCDAVAAVSAAPASGGPCLCVGCLHGHDGGTRMCPEPEWCECGECWGRPLAMFDDQGRV